MKELHHCHCQLSWLSNSHFFTQPLDKEQPLSFMFYYTGSEYSSSLTWPIHMWYNGQSRKVSIVGTRPI